MVNAYFIYRGEIHTVLIDEADLPVLETGRWSITNCSRHPNHPKFYLRRRKWEGGKQKSVDYLHRVLTGALPGVVVDHLDGNGLNNTRANLRITTQADNARRERQRPRRP